MGRDSLLRLRDRERAPAEGIEPDRVARRRLGMSVSMAASIGLLEWVDQTTAQVTNWFTTPLPLEGEAGGRPSDWSSFGAEVFSCSSVLPVSAISLL